MNCYCCGKPLKNDSIGNWHRACIKKFFGTSSLPEIKIDDKSLEDIAIQNTSKGLTVPGIQKKMSLHLQSIDGKPRLTLVNYPTGYILKPQVKEFEQIPEAEHLVMSMADMIGIATVPHALIQNGDQLAYITKRIDRFIDCDQIKRIAMEDFCQLDMRLTADKYRGSYERCAKVIEKYSSRSGIDMTEMFIRLVFCFIVGNSDMHLKNFSLMESDYMSNTYVLSPAYDLVPVNVLMPEDVEQFALPMNGKKQNLRRKDFLIFAETCGLSQKSAEKMIAKVISFKDNYITMCNESLLSDELKERFCELITERTNMLS